MEDIYVSIEDMPESLFEVVERKGVGHPDTLSDALAEEISRVYSRYTLSKFGAILHHNFDKIGILGGESHVEFGKGYITKPLRVLINGRASASFGNQQIDVEKMIERISKNFFTRHFPNINKEKDIKMLFNLSTASSPGKIEGNLDKKEETRKFMFSPRGLEDLKELKFLGSNDTSLGVGYYPLTKTERIILTIEEMLNSKSYRKENPCIGSDIKIMGSRNGKNLHITLCVPQIADYVADLEIYKKNKAKIKTDVESLLENIKEDFDVIIDINTKDRYEKYDIYLTAIGSSCESGDEGLVGRGNRINGLITPCNPMSIEGACGKNPVYHVGKLYNISARRIAERIYKELGAKSRVFLVSQNGRELIDPKKTFVIINQTVDKGKLNRIIKNELHNIKNIKNDLLKGTVRLY